MRLLLSQQRSNASSPSIREITTVTSILVMFLILGYFFVNLRNDALAGSGYEFYTLHTSLDTFVPFVPDAVFFYYGYYAALFAFPIIAFGSRERLHQVLFGLFVTSLISYSCWALFPVKMIRPDVSACESFACAWVKGMYETDRPYCVLPSMHAGHSMFIMLLVYRYARRFFVPVALFCLGIISSTVLIKQHYIIDLPPGLLVGAFGFWVGQEYGVAAFAAVEKRFANALTTLRLR